MKLKALERATADDRDYQDAIKLGIECGVSTVDALKELFQKFFGNDGLPLAVELRLNELASAIQTNLG
jgi:hypothetical protein